MRAPQSLWWDETVPHLRSPGITRPISQPGRPGLTFLAVGPLGLGDRTNCSVSSQRAAYVALGIPRGRESESARSRNISMRSLRSGKAHRRSLGFARDDKGEGSAHLCSRYRGWTEPQVIRFSSPMGEPKAHDYSVERHFHESSAELPIPPRHAGTGGMTKGRAVADLGMSGGG